MSICNVGEVITTINQIQGFIETEKKFISHYNAILESYRRLSPEAQKYLEDQIASTIKSIKYLTSEINTKEQKLAELTTFPQKVIENISEVPEIKKFPPGILSIVIAYLE